jgi:acyl CoA:acetate/3-ketoacid CoA transferase beta subunit
MTQNINTQDTEMVEHLTRSLHLSSTDEISTEIIRGVATLTKRTDRGQIMRYVPHTVISLVTDAGMTSFKDDRKWLICSTRNMVIDQIVSATTLGASVIGRRLVMSEAVEQKWDICN